MALFFEPKPRQLHSAAIGLRRAPRVRDEVHVAVRIGLARLIVGGRKPSRSASAAVTMPAAPLAPCGWPIIDLVDEPGTAIGDARRTACRTHRDSTASFNTVEVPWIVHVADLFERTAGSLDARAASRGRSARRRDPSARGDRRRRSSRSRRSSRRPARRARRARSSRSSTTIHAPSPRTKPSRPRSNGRDASAGVSLYASRPRASSRSRRSSRA